MSFDKMLKSSMTEIAAFSKKNAKKYSILRDLHVARLACKTKEARTLIDTILIPFQGDLQKERLLFDAKMSKIWKGTKPKEIPNDAQKNLDDALKKAAKSIESDGGPKTKYNSNPSHKNWIQIESFSQ